MTEDIMALADTYAAAAAVDDRSRNNSAGVKSTRAALQAAVERLERKNEVLRHERNAARNQVDIGVKLLTGIHSLLYPPLTKLPDGRVMAFRPKDPDPHAVLQELSDRIRALPEEVNRLEREAAMQRVSEFAQEQERMPLTPKQVDAMAIIFASKKVSVSEVQRKMKISYGESQELCQSLVDAGWVDQFPKAPSLNIHGIKEAS